MATYKYVIVGGGMTADAAVKGIREVDPDGSIGLVSDENDAPYKRPPLSKGLWKDTPLDNIWCKTDSRGVMLHLGRRVQSIDLRRKQVADDQGGVYTFDKLLLATGGTPRRLPFGGDRVIYFRTLRDYRALRALAERGRKFAVIGGGFIGAEIAAALAMNQKDVTMAFPEEGIGARVFPRALSLFLNDYYRQKGVTVLEEHMVIGLEDEGKQMALRLRATKDAPERRLLVDGVVAGVGIQPNVELAEKAGLAVDNGIVVDETLRAGHPGVFAAGDVAAFPSPTLGRRVRVEHEDNANTMGRCAGRAMAGKAAPYHHLPFFYSDLFDLGYEAVGDLDSRLETVEDWKEPHREGVVYYLKQGRVRGVLLWNVWDQVDAARRLIAEPGPHTSVSLKGRLPAAK